MGDKASLQVNTLSVPCPDPMNAMQRQVDRSLTNALINYAEASVLSVCCA